jgi:two-component system, chemotaxis family, chemotaxis protein CheY
MRALIVEDDFMSRTVLMQLLSGFGEVHVAVNGQEGVDAVKMNLYAHTPYDLILLDIMLPVMDGQQALKEIRRLEEQHNAVGKKAIVIMTTALHDPDNVLAAYREQCDGYLAKPILKSSFLKLLHIFGFALKGPHEAAGSQLEVQEGDPERE